MTSAYYSTIFRTPAAEVWEIVRDFNNYPVWVDGAGESEIEDGKAGDAVGAVRSVHFNGRHIRQRLLALSDVERSQTYEFGVAAGLRFPGDLAHHAGRRRRRRFHRMVGGFRLRRGPARGVERHVARLVRDMAGIAARGER